MASRKDQLLGMAHGTAANRLRKLIMFDMARRLGLLICYRCGCCIERPEEFSIEHKEPWQAATDPNIAFFDLSNIAFSHLRCNVEAAGPSSLKSYENHKERKRAQFSRYYERNKDAILLRKRQRYARGKE